jgi:hypothetical protein
MAMGAVRALRDAGLGCPGDVSVVGYNDVPMADCLDPPLTTVRLDGNEVGRRAGEAILAAIRGLPVPDGGPPVPAKLIARSSAAPLQAGPVPGPVLGPVPDPVPDPVPGPVLDPVDSPEHPAQRSATLPLRGAR